MILGDCDIMTAVLFVAQICSLVLLFVSIWIFYGHKAKDEGDNDDSR